MDDPVNMLEGNAMSTSIHGHDVFHFIRDATHPLTRQQIEDAFIPSGSEAQTFHTCTGRDMNLDQILAFHMQRGKIARQPDGTYICTHVCTCEHEHGHDHHHEHHA
jgi:probable metal-binding protein